MNNPSPTPIGTTYNNKTHPSQLGEVKLQLMAETDDSAAAMIASGRVRDDVDFIVMLLNDRSECNDVYVYDLCQWRDRY